MNEQPIAPQQNAFFSLPIRVSIASVTLSLTQDDTVPEGPARKVSGFSQKFPVIFGGRNMTGLIVGCVSGILGLVLLESVFWHPARNSATPSASTVDMHAAHTTAVSPGFDTNRPMTDSALGRAVIDALREGGLGGVGVAVSSGVVSVSGDISEDHNETLRNIEQWFDATYGGRYVWLSNVKILPKKILSLPIQSVWNGPEANVTMHNQRYYIGSSLNSGQKLQSIGPHKIVIFDGKDEFSIAY